MIPNSWTLGWEHRITDACGQIARIKFDLRITQSKNGATISLRSDLHRSIFRSIVLEELVQSLGLVMDIDSKHYRSKSIFSERANRIKRLKGQDAMAFRMHYPIDG